mgnify:FL=1
MIFDNIKVDIFGSSHADKIGVTVSGLPVGFKVDENKLQAFVDRRKAVSSPWSTRRIEPDEVEFEKGIEKGVITGEVTGVIKNTNVRSNDYDNLQYIPRPSHADYPAKLKYGIDYDVKGGGAFSGRMTAPLCIAGGIAKQVLEEKGVYVGAYVSKIGNVSAKSYLDGVSKEEIEKAHGEDIALLSNKEKIVKLIEETGKNEDSVGGEIECVVKGVKGGLGGALFDGVESKIAGVLFGVPAVKSVEFGLGKGFAEAKASEVNDEYYYEEGKVRTYSNNNGGLLGGITTGEDILVRVTLKPTPSIRKEQRSINLKTKENVTIQIKGRHDVCIVPRAVVPVEACVCLALLDLIGE